MSEPAFLSVDPQMLKSDERILVAAMRVFADLPLERASLRMIAKEAGISFSAITYHFGTKENLYREVVSRALRFILSSLPTLHEEFPETITPKQAREELRTIVCGISEQIYGTSNASLLARILIREHLTPSAVYDTLFEQFFRKVITRIARLVRVLCKTMDTRRATLQAFNIIGQVVAFRLERELMIRQLQFTGFSPEETAELKGILEENIFRQLGVK